jgi:hypothetical protein
VGGRWAYTAYTGRPLYVLGDGLENGEEGLATHPGFLRASDRKEDSMIGKTEKPSASAAHPYTPMGEGRS